MLGLLLANPDKRDKCLHQIFFLLKNKKKISKALTGEPVNRLTLIYTIGETVHHAFFFV